MEAPSRAPAADNDFVEPPRKRVKHDGSFSIAVEPCNPENMQATRQNLDISDRQPVSLKPSTVQVVSSAPYDMADARSQDVLYNQDSKEAACGITEFVCPDLLGFTGIFKKRYTDFLVNEILPSGQVVHLKNIKVPGRENREEGLGRDVSTAPQGFVDKDTSNESACNEASISHIPRKVETEARELSSMEPATSLEIPASSCPPDPSLFQQMEARGAPIEDSANLNSLQAPEINKAPIPSSIQDFDLPVNKPKTLAPHMRVPAPTQSIPLSMQHSGNKPEQPKRIRKKETVRIRQTSEGWIEVNEFNDKEAKITDPTESAEIEGETEDSAIGGEEEKPIVDESTIAEHSAPSTQALWQNFATETAAKTGASTDFQLNPSDLIALLSYFGSNIAHEILALNDSILKAPQRRSKDHGTVKSAAIDRHTRSKIHQDLRRMFDSRLESMTDNDGAIVITASSGNPAFFARTPMENDRRNNTRNRRDNNTTHRERGGNRNSGTRPESHLNRHNKWAELGGDFLHFSLYKENKDTMECVSWLTRQLDMKPSAFQFAGTKDRRGVTVQRVSVYRVIAARMLRASLSLRNAKIGDFEYRPHSLQLGELTGNEFVITLRDCDFHHPIPVDSKTMVEAAQAVVGEAIKNLAINGFINYYGLQRFGTFATSTDQVGLRMLQGDFKAAVDGILQFNAASLEAAQDMATAALDRQSKDDLLRATAINAFNTTGKADRALRDLPRKFAAERSVIQHLGRRKNDDYFGALHTVSRNLRLMYVHAYQSLVWNQAASERWKRLGATVVEGDLVLVDEHKDKTEPQAKAQDVDQDGEAIVRPSADDRATNPEDMFTRARLLSKEEAESGNYTIFDIVLPTPGYDILYPTNQVGKFYETFMASERGGGLNPHDMRRKWKDVSLSGSYRKLLAKPSEDFSFDIKVYKDDDEKFVQTDLDRLEKAKQERLNAQHKDSAPIHDDPAQSKAETTGDDHDTQSDATDASSKSKSNLNHEAHPSSTDSEPGGVKLSGGPYQDYKIAVILKLQLGSSTYATMALRELMKHGGARTWKPDFASDR